MAYFLNHVTSIQKLFLDSAITADRFLTLELIILDDTIDYNSI